MPAMYLNVLSSIRAANRLICKNCIFSYEYLECTLISMWLRELHYKCERSHIQGNNAFKHL